eukprot:71536-Rhodomonas_salina.2
MGVSRCGPLDGQLDGPLDGECEAGAQVAGPVVEWNAERGPERPGYAGLPRRVSVGGFAYEQAEYARDCALDSGAVEVVVQRDQHRPNLVAATRTTKTCVRTLPPLFIVSNRRGRGASGELERQLHRLQTRNRAQSSAASAQSELEGDCGCLPADPSQLML